jgi:hypothetical protein
MEQYYRKVQEKVMVQRDVINSLLKDPRIIGDYYEAIVRDAVREAMPVKNATSSCTTQSNTGRYSVRAISSW